MKAPAFRYMRAASRRHGLDLLARYGTEARVLAGGQSLMPMLNLRLARPAVLIDINGIADMSAIAVEGGVLRIGALCRHREVAESPLVRAHAPLLPAALAHVAHAAIRNRGTIGGSLALADPAAEMPACALALDAVMVIESADGARRVPAGKFFRGLFETALGPRDLLVAVEFSLRPEDSVTAIEEVARRGGDYALVGGILAARRRGRALADPRLVFFGVGDRPVRAGRAEAALASSADAAATLEQVQAALTKDLSPLADPQASVAMRRHLARVVAARLIGKAGVS